MDVQPEVRTLALHPFRELPVPSGVERIERAGILLYFHPHPTAEVVEPLDLTVEGVPGAVAVARALARERGKRLLAWLIGPEHDDLGSALKAEGLVSEDTAGFEAVETAMVLVEPPSGVGNPEITVRAVESYEALAAGVSVMADAFEVSAAVRADAVARLAQHWDEYRQPGNPRRQYLARIGDEVVGSASATFGDAGVGLFGGAVLAHARGRGVYRALTVARWEEAVRRGSPALTVLAGRMSLPILTKLGFAPVGEICVYADDVEATN